MIQLDLTPKLAHTITLTGGPRSHLVTLQDAATLIRRRERGRRAKGDKPLSAGERKDASGDSVKIARVSSSDVRLVMQNDVQQ
jgi:hypothetical protein